MSDNRGGNPMVRDPNQGDGRHVVRFKANQIQGEFIRSRAKADLWACRMGEGKSTALAWAIYYHTRRNPGARWAVVRDTWENLRDTTQKTFFDWFPPGVMGEYRASTKTWTWRLDGMRGEIMWLGLDEPRDASKLQSRELAGVAMDEPAPAADSGGIDELIFNTAMTRLRQPGMNWYAAKLAENSPDELHWTYRQFVDEDERRPNYRYFRSKEPENEANLPGDYYENLRMVYKDRPDLIRRFAEGDFGFQQIGRSVTPEWSDDIHLGRNLEPLPGSDLTLLWDFGLNPTCLITQVTPLGAWHVIEAFVGEGIGVEELIEGVVKPVLARDEYRRFNWKHIGDPAGKTREQSSSERSAVKSLKQMLGGRWVSGPVRLDERVEPARAVLRRTRGGRGVVLVDRHKAKPLWMALRGGWHYPESRQGVVSEQPRKNIHSHPGDAFSYGAAKLFPMGRLRRGHASGFESRGARYFRGGLGFERPGLKVPKEAQEI